MVSIISCDCDEFDNDFVCGWNLWNTFFQKSIALLARVNTFAYRWAIFSKSFSFILGVNVRFKLRCLSSSSLCIYKKFIRNGLGDHKTFIISNRVLSLLKNINKSTMLNVFLSYHCLFLILVSGSIHLDFILTRREIWVCKREKRERESDRVR